MNRSLNDLKDAIDGSDVFGPLPRGLQRIFHLGRELKTGGRYCINQFSSVHSSVLWVYYSLPFVFVTL
jgi:hypothetical protein